MLGLWACVRLVGLLFLLCFHPLNMHSHVCWWISELQHALTSVAPERFTSYTKAEGGFERPSASDLSRSIYSRCERGLECPSVSNNDRDSIEIHRMPHISHIRILTRWVGPVPSVFFLVQAQIVRLSSVLCVLLCTGMPHKRKQKRAITEPHQHRSADTILHLAGKGSLSVFDTSAIIKP